MHSSSNRIIGSECWMFCPYIFLDGDTISQMRHRGTHFRPAAENLRKVTSRSLLERSLPASPDNLGLARKCSRQQKIHRAAEPAYACVGTLGGVKPFYEMPAVPRGERVEEPALLATPDPAEVPRGPRRPHRRAQLCAEPYSAGCDSARRRPAST